MLNEVNKECSICYGEIEQEVPYRHDGNEKCQAFFHSVCIAEWKSTCLKNNREESCPCCTLPLNDRSIAIRFQGNRLNAPQDIQVENPHALGVADILLPILAVSSIAIPLFLALPWNEILYEYNPDD